MAIELERRRFTVEEYHRMAEAGILGEDDRIELIEGEIVLMSPIGPRHVWNVNRLNMAFTPRLGDAAVGSVQNPVVLDDYSESEPDFMLLRPPDPLAEPRLPRPEDVLLLVEVSDSSTEKDIRVKVPLYARSRIPECWVAMIREDAVAVHREPSADGYRLTTLVRRGQRLQLLAFPEWSIPVEDILGPTPPGAT